MEFDQQSLQSYFEDSAITRRNLYGFDFIRNTALAIG